MVTNALGQTTSYSYNAYNELIGIREMMSQPQWKVSMAGWG